jgi:hypothetical protein
MQKWVSTNLGIPRPNKMNLPTRQNQYGDEPRMATNFLPASSTSKETAPETGRKQSFCFEFKLTE